MAEEDDGDAGTASLQSSINALRRAGLGYHDFREEMEPGLQLRPDPNRDILAGRVFEAGNLIEIMVVELFPKRLEGFGDVSVID